MGVAAGVGRRGGRGGGGGQSAALFVVVPVALGGGRVCSARPARDPRDRPGPAGIRREPPGTVRNPPGTAGNPPRPPATPEPAQPLRPPGGFGGFWGSLGGSLVVLSPLPAPQPPEPSRVRVRLLWDVLSPDPESCPPLYVIWRLHSSIPPRLQPWGPPARPFSLPFLEALLGHVGLNEVHKAIGLFLETLADPGAPQTLHRGIYRELLFLTLAALGREHTDIAAFDRRYRSALAKLGGAPGRDELRRRRAQPPSARASECRRCFGAPPEC
ncbi:DENN domain-containing protein 4B-like [Zonotrichia leucophrys gambelii]|uniref:DENN domain-containing protein 4B-like n=1 Tax=Zonotrichia leucophrys gambelii TaxID=257770 RepID=UPI00313FFC59